MGITCARRSGKAFVARRWTAMPAAGQTEIRDRLRPERLLKSVAVHRCGQIEGRGKSSPSVHMWMALDTWLPVADPVPSDHA